MLVKADNPTHELLVIHLFLDSSPIAIIFSKDGHNSRHDGHDIFRRVGVSFDLTDILTSEGGDSFVSSLENGHGLLQVLSRIGSKGLSLNSLLATAFSRNLDMLLLFVCFLLLLVQINFEVRAFLLLLRDLGTLNLRLSCHLSDLSGGRGQTSKTIAKLRRLRANLNSLCTQNLAVELEQLDEVSGCHIEDAAQLTFHLQGE